MSIQQAYLGFELDSAAEADPRVIRGIANTGGVMRSGRMIHPAFFEQWLASGDGSVPLMAQHGHVDGFATVGRAQLSFSGGKLRFEARLAEGTPLAEDALALVKQGMLRTVSVGWNTTQARLVTSEDADIDPVVAKALKRAGRREAYVFFRGEIVELSLVDVPDDAGALIGAGLGELRSEIAQLRATLHGTESQAFQLESGPGAADIAKLVTAQLTPLLAAAAAQACEAHFEAICSRFEERLNASIEDLATNLSGDYAARLLGEDLAECEHRADAADSAPPGASGAAESAALGSSLARLLERARRGKQ